MPDSCGLQRFDDHVSYSHPCHGFHPEVGAQQSQSGALVDQPTSVAFMVSSSPELSLSRDMGSLSQAAAERYVLAGNFVEHDQQIVRRDSSSRHHSVIQGLQQS